MVQLSTVVIAALAIVPALASQVTDFEARDTQDLEVRGTKSTRSFDDFDLEVRSDKQKRGNRRTRNQNQPQRQSTGLSSSAGQFVGSAVKTAVQGGEERRAFSDEDMEARDGEKKRRRRRSRKQRAQVQPQTTEGGEQTAGTTRDLEDFDLEVRFDFEDLDFEARMDSEDLDLEARNDEKKKKRKSGNRRNQNQPQRQSTGLSSSAGRFVGSTINSAVQGGGERRAFFDEEDIEARDGEKKRRRRRSRKQRVQVQPQTTEGGEQTAGSTRDFEDFDLEARTRRNRQSTGLSDSAGRFVGSTINSALNGREFVDEYDLEARDGEAKRRRRRGRKQRKQQQQQPQTTEGQTTGSGETREFVDEDFTLEAREIDELD